MTWLQRYQLRRMSRGSLWLLPALSILVVLVVVAPLVRRLDRATGWTWFNLPPESARLVLGALTASMLTFVVFVVSSMLIVVQLSSAQVTPRIIAMAFADRRVKWVLSAFTFAYAYTIAAAARVEDVTPQLPAALAVVLDLACIALFFWFAQAVGTSLRPITILVRVAREGLAVVEDIYPEMYYGEEKPCALIPRPPTGWVVVDHAGPPGVLLAFGHEELVALAERSDATIELIPRVGDFLSTGEPLFRVSAGGRPLDADLLRGCIAVGSGRTMEQDPQFAFRIIVDIANKALSPAINDPTTAVLALDQLHRLLKNVGRRRLYPGQHLDARGHVRLLYRTPDWADFVTLAVTEIRHYGAGSLQVARRLRAMLEHLMRVLPDARRDVLEQELQLLYRATERLFADDEDRARARVGDLQGIGGSMSSSSLDRHE
jgi:uncharacterized membrane protein